MLSAQEYLISTGSIEKYGELKTCEQPTNQ